MASAFLRTHLTLFAKCMYLKIFYIGFLYFCGSDNFSLYVVPLAIIFVLIFFVYILYFKASFKIYVFLFYDLDLFFFILSCLLSLSF